LIKDGLIYPGPGYILQSPAGTGKTLTGLELARREGRKTLWITHTKELANQTLHAASNQSEVEVLGLPKSEIGVIGMGKFKIGEFLTIATVQTLNRRQSLVKDLKYEFGTIIVDEVHHAPALTWKTGAHMFAPAITIGLTATSYRADGLTQMLFDCVGPVVGVADRKLLIEENVLVIPEYCLLYTGINYSGATFADIVSRLVSDPRRNAIFLHIMTEIMQQNEYNVVLLLSGRVQHIEDLTKLCIEQGLQPIKLLGTLSELERAVAFEKLQSKKPRLLLATYGLLAEGFDYPPISHVILGTPFKNPVRLEQCAGRAQRPYQHKADSFVIDAIDENAMLHKQARTRRALALGFGMPMITYNSKLFGENNAT
jgi:superfamily II DNA or RNA helicase